METQHNLLTISIDRITEPDQLIKLIATVKMFDGEVARVQLSGSDAFNLKEVQQVAVLDLLQECKNYALQYRWEKAGTWKSLKESSQSSSDISDNT